MSTTSALAPMYRMFSFNQYLNSSKKVNDNKIEPQSLKIEKDTQEDTKGKAENKLEGYKNTEENQDQEELQSPQDKICSIISNEYEENGNKIKRHHIEQRLNDFEIMISPESLIKHKEYQNLSFKRKIHDQEQEQDVQYKKEQNQDQQKDKYLSPIPKISMTNVIQNTQDNSSFQQLSQRSIDTTQNQTKDEFLIELSTQDKIKPFSHQETQIKPEQIKIFQQSQGKESPQTMENQKKFSKTSQKYKSSQVKFLEKNNNSLAQAHQRLEIGQENKEEINYQSSILIPNTRQLAPLKVAKKIFDLSSTQNQEEEKKQQQNEMSLLKPQTQSKSIGVSPVKSFVPRNANSKKQGTDLQSLQNIYSPQSTQSAILNKQQSTQFNFLGINRKQAIISPSTPSDKKQTDSNLEDFVITEHKSLKKF